MQRTTAYFLSLGHYDALIRRMGRAYADRRRVMDAAIAAEGLTVVGQSTSGGSSVWMRAPDGVDTGALAWRLQAQGVLIEPGTPFFAGPNPPAKLYRLAYSSIPATRIAEGVGLIARAM